MLAFRKVSGFVKFRASDQTSGLTQLPRWSNHTRRQRATRSPGTSCLTVLNPQIEYLTECRPMCFAMGNAIRLLKAKVGKFDIDTSEEEAKQSLLESIDSFINERITLAELVIAKNAAEMINNGDVVLTYGRHRLVEKTIRQAHDDGKKFEVSILDDPFDKTWPGVGQDTSALGAPCFLLAPSWWAARRYCKSQHRHVRWRGSVCEWSALCSGWYVRRLHRGERWGEARHSSLRNDQFRQERVSTDSLTYNEIDPERSSPESFRLLFDTTRDKYISAVITEYESETGNSPSQAILSILRKQEDPSVA